MHLNLGFTVMRFAQLAPGDLFVTDFRDSSSVALKVVEESDGSEAILLLGPEGVQFIGQRRLSVMSFAKDYEIRVPATPDTWVLNEQPAAPVFLALESDGHIYFRVPIAVGECFVNAETGVICSTPPAGQIAYAKKWEIVVPEKGGGVQVVMTHG